MTMMIISDWNKQTTSPQDAFDRWCAYPTWDNYNSIKVPKDFDINVFFWEIINKLGRIRGRRHICLLSLNRVARINLMDFMKLTATTQRMHHVLEYKYGADIGSCCVGYNIIQEHFYRNKFTFELVLASGGDSQTFCNYIEPFTEHSKFVLHLYH